MKTIIKAIARKIMPAAFILAVVFLLAPVSAQAAKKPGKVTKLEEVKATDKSITVKFKKVKGAKKYQVRVYEARRKTKAVKSTNSFGKDVYDYQNTWSVTKRLAKKTETKKTTCTVKGLVENKGYAIKVRAYNGKAYGKWTTLYAWTNYEGIPMQGKRASTGSNLKKQYEAWRSGIIKKAKEEESDLCEEILGFFAFGFCSFKCKGYENRFIENPAQYRMDNIYNTYKNGQGTNLEIYQVALDVCRHAGVKCAIRRRQLKYLGGTSYGLTGWTDDCDAEGNTKLASLSVSPGSRGIMYGYDDGIETDISRDMETFFP